MVDDIEMMELPDRSPMTKVCLLTIAQIDDAHHLRDEHDPPTHRPKIKTFRFYDWFSFHMSNQHVC